MIEHSTSYQHEAAQRAGDRGPGGSVREGGTEGTRERGRENKGEGERHRGEREIKRVGEGVKERKRESLTERDMN